MFFEIIIFILIGCFLGIITGLTPGIHINLVSALIVSAASFLLGFVSEIGLVILIISMSITHIFLDSIPSIFLGAPSPDSAVIIMPAHKMLLEGRAHEAVILTLISTISSITLIISLFPILIFALPRVYPLVKDYIYIILILAVSFLILREKNKMQTLLVFSLAGTLGLVVLNIPNMKEPLLPLLSGLFGLSSLILSIKNNTKIPEQIITKLKITQDKIKYVILGVISGIFSGFLPGLGSSQMSVLSSSVIKKMESKDFLILNSSINAVNMVVSFIALYAINKARSGSAVAVSKILEKITLTNMILIISVILISVFIATLLTINLSRIFSKLISKINYKLACIAIIFLLIVLVLVISEPLGLLVLLTSTSLGMYTQLKSINKNHLMACILIPVIFFFIL